MDTIAYLVGAGSMTLGMERAGLNVREIWETPGYSNNAQSWDLNRPDLPHQVIDLDFESNHFAGRGAELIYGNPPCGGVSTMGAAGCNNPTNAGMRHWIRMVAKGRPRVIIMESGYQLASPKMAPLLGDLVDVLDEAGYYWWVWMFYSYQVGTPQLRRRCFLVASLDEPVNDELLDLTDLPAVHPDAACGSYLLPLLNVEPSPNMIQVGDTEVWQHWWDTTGVKWNACVPGNGEWFERNYITPKQLIPFARRLQEADAAEAPDLDKVRHEYDKHHRICWHDCPTDLDISQFFKRLTKVDPAEPAPTMIGVFRFVHPWLERLLTMREMALLMGYPLGWKFHKLDPHYAIQGVPAQNAFWVADRALRVIGQR